MVVKEKSARGIDTIPLSSVFIENRDIFLKGEISTEVADEFCEQFIYLLRRGNDPIRVWISSYGGSVIDGLRIYDLISSVKNIKVYTIAYGAAYSMAGVLLAAGTKGCRLMLPHTRLMLHPATFVGGCSGKLSDIRAKSNMLEEYEEIINQILSKHSGLSVKKIIEDNSYDHFYTAEEAIKNGYCDRIACIDDLVKG